jgi:hypothetical protein
MEYSAETARLAYGTVLFLLPHLLLAGLLPLICTYRKRCVMQEMSGIPCFVVQGFVGALFFSVASYALVSGAMSTLECRRAEQLGKTESLSGTIESVRELGKPGTWRVQFQVADRLFTTNSEGLACDCGFILPLGNTLRLEEGMKVELKAFQNTVVFLKVVQLPPIIQGAVGSKSKKQCEKSKSSRPFGNSTLDSHFAIPLPGIDKKPACSEKD